MAEMRPPRLRRLKAVFLKMEVNHGPGGNPGGLLSLAQRAEADNAMIEKIEANILDILGENRHSYDK